MSRISPVIASEANPAVAATVADSAGVKRIYFQAAKLDRLGMGMLRLGLVIVLVWIGGLKFASYEADGIVLWWRTAPS